ANAGSSAAQAARTIGVKGDANRLAARVSMAPQGTIFSRMSRFAARIPAWCLAFLLAVPLIHAVPLDIGNPVYPFLRRLELEGRIPPGHLTTLPIAKSEAAGLL